MSALAGQSGFGFFQFADLCLIGLNDPLVGGSHDPLQQRLDLFFCINDLVRHLPDEIVADALVYHTKIRLEWVNSMQVSSLGFGGAMASAAQVMHAQQAWNQIEDNMAAAELLEVERL